MQSTRFPVGFWNYGDWPEDIAERVREWADLKFTLAMSPPFSDTPEDHARVRKLLDLAHDHGIQLILLDERTRAPGKGWWSDYTELLELPADYRTHAAAAIKDFAEHPAVWGFYVTDEPVCGNLPATAEACRIIRELTDQAEPYINLLPDHIVHRGDPGKSIEKQVGFEDYNKYLDHLLKLTGNGMLCFDCYCQMSEEWGGRDQYFRNLAKYQAAAKRHNVPFWIITLAVGHWMYKAPTPIEMGWQFYSALAYGAQGIMYFLYRAGGIAGEIGCYGAPVDELGQRGPLYQQLRRQHHQFQTQWERQYRRLTPVKTMHWPEGPPGTSTFDGTGIVRAICECPEVITHHTSRPQVLIGEFIDEQRRPHVLIVNNSTEKHTLINITFSGKIAYEIRGPQEETQIADSATDTATVRKFIMPGHGLFFRVE